MSEIFTVNDNIKIAVLQTFGKTKEDLDNDVIILKEWLKKQPHLAINIDDHRLKAFILRNKFRMEETKKKIDKYYSLKQYDNGLAPWIDLKNSKNIELLKSFILCPMKNLTKNRERVYVSKFCEGVFNMDIMFSIGLMNMELALSHDFASSDVYVCDYAQLTMTHVAEFNVFKMIKFIEIHQKAASGRFAAVYFLNLSTLLDVVMKILKVALPEKLYQRIKILKCTSELAEILGQDCLPVDFGGNQKNSSELYGEWINILSSNSKWLLDRSKEKSNKSLRTDSNGDSDIHGIKGTFRKLNLD